MLLLLLLRKRSRPVLKKSVACQTDPDHWHLYTHSSHGHSEFDTIVHHYKDILTAITVCVRSLTTDAFSKKLIPEEVSDDITATNNYSNSQKANTFLLAVKNRIKGDSSAFYTFLDVLSSEPALEYLATRLKETKALKDTQMSPLNCRQ